MRASRRWTKAEVEALRSGTLTQLLDVAKSHGQEALEGFANKVLHRKLEALFQQHLEWTGMLPVFEMQVRFHPTRQWRFDFYARDYKLAVELHGGIFSNGAHTRGNHFGSDREKANAAQEMGITLLEFTGPMLHDGTAIAQTERLLMARGWSRST